MIPKVNGQHQRKSGAYILPQAFTVELGRFAPWCLEAFCQRSDRVCEPANRNGNMRLIHNSAVTEEGYRLTISEAGIEIHASSERGVVWALTTVYAVIEEDGTIPFCAVSDCPRYSYRSVMLDCVRHFFDAQEVKRVIEEMSLVKLNVLHWHLSNDQGFRVESKRFPALCRQPDNLYYTQEEIRNVVEYARVRGVEIIPELSMPGHTTAILSAYPEYSCRGEKVSLGKTGGIYPVVLCPGQEKVYHFLKELLDEICPLFPSEWFHIGGDECPDWEWQECPHCKALMDQEGLASTRELQGYFSKRVKDMLKAHGKNVICFNDTLMAPNFPWRNRDGQRTRIQYWSIQYADSMQEYIRQGGDFIYSDMFELYLDYPPAMSSIQKVYQCEPAVRDTVYSNAAGIEACLWTEYVDTNELLEQRLFPRVYALAENAWCAEGDYSDFLARLEEMIPQARERGVACLSASEADPQGEEKKQGIMAYTATMNTMPPEMRELAVKFTQPNQEFQSRFMEKFFGVKPEKQ